MSFELLNNSPDFFDIFTSYNLHVILQGILLFLLFINQNIANLKQNFKQNQLKITCLKNLLTNMQNK